MRPQDLTLRCYAEQQDRCLWVAVCVDLGLAAQGKTYKEARQKLKEQINAYVYDALVGEDQAYAAQLLHRKSPLRQRLKYQMIHLHLAGLLFRHKVRDFISNLPLAPFYNQHVQ